ncbi:MAG: hypothetical protein PF436_02760 [Prolixibacteraceae bacterium]|jgi:hypothetical protein|nr:hypothetical protein [Prolixibacteraceae bacterium]
MKKLKQIIVALIILAAFGCKTTSAQQWVADTLTVSVWFPDTTRSSANIKTVNDNRNCSPKLLSVYEEKKLLIFPVDQVVQTTKPLSSIIQKQLSTPTSETSAFDIDIQQFNIERTSSMFKNQYKLYASIGIQETGAPATTGTLYYEQTTTQNRKATDETAYVNVIQNWGEKFTSDLHAIGHGLDTMIAGSVPRFRRGSPPAGQNFYVETEFFAGLRFWGIDAALWFSEPEGSTIFNRSIRMMRYVEHPNVRAIAFGRDIRRWNYRLNDRWLFDNKIVLLFGINNWKDMDTSAHKLEEILYMNTSFTQRVTFNQRDKSGLIFGVGVIEDVHYIIHHRIKLNIGVSLSCAYKF